MTTTLGSSLNSTLGSSLNSTLGSSLTSTLGSSLNSGAESPLINDDISSPFEPITAIILSTGAVEPSSIPI